MTMRQMQRRPLLTCMKPLLTAPSSTYPLSYPDASYPFLHQLQVEVQISTLAFPLLVPEVVVELVDPVPLAEEAVALAGEDHLDHPRATDGQVATASIPTDHAPIQDLLTAVTAVLLDHTAPDPDLPLDDEVEGKIITTITMTDDVVLATIACEAAVVPVVGAEDIVKQGGLGIRAIAFRWASGRLFGLGPKTISVLRIIDINYSLAIDYYLLSTR